MALDIYPTGMKFSAKTITASTDIAVETADGMSYTVSEKTTGDVDEYTFVLKWTPDNATANNTFLFKWNVPVTEVMYTWSPLSHMNKATDPDWGNMKHSMLCSNAPVIVMFNGKSESVYSFAVSECQKVVSFHAGINEESARLFCRVGLSVGQFTGVYGTTIKIRISATRQPIADEVRGISSWWEKDCGMTPMYVPSVAHEPLYSFWYSYHWDFTSAEIEAECRRAKALGFKVCILDGGWVTDVISRGLTYAGDWIPSPRKLGDMKAHVARVHDIGVKYMLWFALPCVGAESKAYVSWKDKGIGQCLNSVVVDPRYPAYRAYIIETLCRAVGEWGLDGLKLDFIDCYHNTDIPFGDGMDIVTVYDAVERLMSDIVTALQKIKRDVLIEFRQGYIGPCMRKYGNMFRVGDCPDDYIRNRVGIFDLRMAMGKSAVHSDMLMWHEDLAPELAAIQIISCMFGVVQYSMKLSKLNERAKKMSVCLLDFLRQHRTLLQSDSLQVYEPQLNYTWAKVSDADTCIAAVYAVDKCVWPDDRQTVCVFNGCENEQVILSLPKTAYRVEICDCCGEVCAETTVDGGFVVLDVPVGGKATLTKR